MSDPFGRKRSKGVFATLVSKGDWLYTRLEYKKAIESYTTALSLKPKDRTCFVGRSRCYLKLGQYVDALIDADASLAEEKIFSEGLYQKAEALYHMGEFEFALMFYHKGQKLRPQIEEFRLGIQKATKAIEDTIGPPSVKLEMKGDLSFLRNDDEEADPMAILEQLMKKGQQKPEKTPKNEKTSKQLLGEFYGDKKHLESLLKDKDLTQGTTRSGEPLKDVIQDCLRNLNTCTELWGQEKPIGSSARETKNRVAKNDKPSPNTTSEQNQCVLKSLEEINEDLSSGNTEVCIKKADEVMKMILGCSERDMPNKKVLLGKLHSCIGNAYLEIGDIDKALEHHQKDLELAMQCKLSDVTSQALGAIGQIYAQIGHFLKAIEFWSKKIPLVTDGEEKAWLFHELGRCYLELGGNEDARNFGVRSLTAADEISDEKWKIMAIVLISQAESKLGNFESSVSCFERALNLAKLQDDDDPTMLNDIQKALDEAKQHLPK
ncbi:outer dynein arm-docking complex subunit 4 [Nelusetta ayraudi]|uniref:outer dynein arm-docking complex subunit 4 n=1 Tax=Nelusetta ayraudi TaxID=303726 RepID=UPI003F6F1CBC